MSRIFRLIAWYRQFLPTSRMHLRKTSSVGVLMDHNPMINSPIAVHAYLFSGLTPSLGLVSRWLSATRTALDDVSAF